jgi:hypothetical protein
MSLEVRIISAHLLDWQEVAAGSAPSVCIILSELTCSLHCSVEQLLIGCCRCHLPLGKTSFDAAVNCCAAAVECWQPLKLYMLQRPIQLM